MPSDPPGPGEKKGAPGTVGYLYLSFLNDTRQKVEFVPFYYLEAKVDLSDVRSGFRESLSVTRALEIVPLDPDVLWTEDMVRYIDPSLVSDVRPFDARLQPLPSYVDPAHLRWVESQFLSYLMRYFEVRIFHNHALNLYSGAGESREDFGQRCTEVLEEPYRKELDRLHEIFERRLDQVKQRYLKAEMLGDADEDGTAAQIRNRIHDTSERLEQVFLSSGLKSGLVVPERSHDRAPGNELGERLAEIEAEAQAAIHRLAAGYSERAGIADEYTVRPSFRDIRLSSVSILWIPAQARP